jgi:hypothetical protein
MADFWPDLESGDGVAKVSLAAMQVSREAQLQAAEALSREVCYVSGAADEASETSSVNHPTT